MDASFKNKRALVTGAGKGIGRDIAIALYKHGAKVVALSRSQEDLDSLRKEFPKMEVVNQDIGDWSATREVVSGLGHFDLLVNNAAVLLPAPFLEQTRENLETSLDINYKAIFNITQVVARGMSEHGRGGAIVNVSSLASSKVIDGYSVHGPIKAGLDQLTKYMAAELGPHKIRVNSVNPTLILTRMGIMASANNASVDMVVQTVPMRRIPEIEEVTSATLFLLSDQSRIITGINMPVDGGGAVL